MVVLWTLHTKNGVPTGLYVAAYRESEKSISGLLVFGSRVFPVDVAEDDAGGAAASLAAWVSQREPGNTNHVDHVTHACDDRLAAVAMAPPSAVRITREDVSVADAITVHSDIVTVASAPEIAPFVAQLDELAGGLASKL